MFSTEMSALEHAASVVNLSIRMVSFGNTPELTSKYIIKVVAALDATRCFDAAVRACEGKLPRT